MKKLLSLFVAILLVTSIFSGCVNHQQKNPETDVIYKYDERGEKVAISPWLEGPRVLVKKVIEVGENVIILLTFEDDRMIRGMSGNIYKQISGKTDYKNPITIKEIVKFKGFPQYAISINKNSLPKNGEIRIFVKDAGPDFIRNYGGLPFSTCIFFKEQKRISTYIKGKKEALLTLK